MLCSYIVRIISTLVAGVVTHSLDYRKCAGGIIHGFHYTGNVQTAKYYRVYIQFVLTTSDHLSYSSTVVLYCRVIKVRGF